MPTIFRLLSEFAWAIFLAMAAFNYQKARAAVDSFPPERATEAALYLKRLLVGANLPWLVMAAGYLTGFTPTIWYYFRPQDGNVFVLAWLALAFLLSCLFAWWVLLQGGAEKVRDMSLLVVLGQPNVKSLLMIKLQAAAGPLIFPIWIYLAVSMNAEIPR